MSLLVVTAADEAYAALLLDLVRSLGAASARSFKIACVDLGLTPATRLAIASEVDHVTEAAWPFAPHARFDGAPTHLARAIRPFLPRYFPGYETYIWLDSDCWVQDVRAFDFLVQAASRGAVAVVPAVDRAYYHGPEDRAWVHERYRMALGQEQADRLMLFSTINSGVFALKGEAPHWQAWAQRFEQALPRWEGAFLSDQALLNALVYLDRLPAQLLPAEFNWVCHLALPLWNQKRQRFCAPGFPFTTLGILHNSFDRKQEVFTISAFDGSTVETKLTYSGYLGLCQPQ